MNKTEYTQQLHRCGIEDAEDWWNRASKTTMDEEPVVQQQCVETTNAQGQNVMFCFPVACSKNHLLLLNTLGGGEEATVYLGCDDTGLEPAVKIMFDEEQAEHEAQIHKELSDSGLAPHFYSFYSCEGEMQYNLLDYLHLRQHTFLRANG